MNHSQRGLYAEYLVKAKLVEHGHIILEPMAHERFDVAIVDKSRIVRIQIKAAWPEKNGTWRARLFGGTGNRGRGYDKSDAEFFVVVADEKYFIFPNTEEYLSPVFFARKRTKCDMSQFEEKWEILKKRTPGRSVEESARDAKRKTTPSRTTSSSK